MPIRFDDPRPPFEQLAAELRAAIAAGEYQPGDRLPSTRKLAQANGIAETTVQHAMKVLRDEGLVVAQPGRGAFVQHPKTPNDPETTKAPEGDKPPKTLDEALAMLAEMNQTLDAANERIAQLEAEPPGPDHGLGPGQSAGIEP